jgi:hypothetical protein
MPRWKKHGWSHAVPADADATDPVQQLAQQAQTLLQMGGGRVTSISRKQFCTAADGDIA